MKHLECPYDLFHTHIPTLLYDNKIIPFPILSTIAEHHYLYFVFAQRDIGNVLWHFDASFKFLIE